MFCAYTRPRYQVSINRTIGPLVGSCYVEDQIHKSDFPPLPLFSYGIRFSFSLLGQQEIVISLKKIENCVGGWYQNQTIASAL